MHRVCLLWIDINNTMPCPLPLSLIDLQNHDIHTTIPHTLCLIDHQTKKTQNYTPLQQALEALLASARRLTVIAEDVVGRDPRTFTRVRFCCIILML